MTNDDVRASFSASELVIAHAWESFYRMVEPPEEVKADAAQANMKEVIEVVPPKRTPNQKKKVLIK